MADFTLTDETKIVDGVTVYRVEYTEEEDYLLRSNGVLRPYPGGWAEHYRNLDGGRVFDNAVVMGSAVVKGHAVVSGAAIVKGSAVISDRATVEGMAVVSDHAVIADEANVTDYAQVYDHAQVRSSVTVRDFSQIGGTAELSGMGTQFWDRSFVMSGSLHDDFMMNESLEHGLAADSERRPNLRSTPELERIVAILDRREAVRKDSVERNKQTTVAEKVSAALKILTPYDKETPIEFYAEQDIITLNLKGYPDLNQILSEEETLSLLAAGWEVDLDMGTDLTRMTSEAPNWEDKNLLVFDRIFAF
jgi:carbonic anhydrase/acetyltransferase-like protein (isoleucine patch superfamily)